MFVLGVTGGIGSGKSTICKAFGVLGIPVFYSDTAARDLMDTDERLKSEIREVAGDEVYVDKILDRPRLASIIFNDKEMLKRINELVHPVVLNQFRRWAEGSHAPYVILEAAILFESGADKLSDRVAAVTAPYEERIMRVMNRNNLSRDQVIERIQNQMPENEVARRSDYIINNAENTMIIPQVLAVHNEILNLITSNMNG